MSADKTYFVTLVAEAGSASLTVKADSVTEALDKALDGVQAAFQRSTQWHVSEQDEPKS